MIDDSINIPQSETLFFDVVSDNISPLIDCELQERLCLNLDEEACELEPWDQIFPTNQIDCQGVCENDNTYLQFTRCKNSYDYYTL